MNRKGLFLLLGAALQGTVVGCSSNTATPAAQVTPAPVGQVSFDQNVAPLLNTYCTGCHSGPNAPEGVVLSFQNEADARAKATTEEDFWSKVARNISSSVMPPPYAPKKPTDAERAVLVDWINDNVLTSNGMRDPGPFVVRRLNTREYANTIRDLLYLPADYDITADFPADERGDGGFDNYAATLTISPLLIEQYLAAAERASADAFGLNPEMLTPETRTTRDSLASRLKLTAPSRTIRQSDSDPDPLAAVKLSLQTFLARAYRRPVTTAEVEAVMKFSNMSMAHSGLSYTTYDEATALAARAALMSHNFLFRVEADPAPDGTGKVFQLSEYQLANRLSYFLWSSMPDDSLFVAARDGRLRANLDKQVARMLQDPRAISLTNDFLGQWLEIRGLEHVPNVPPDLMEAMRGETQHFFDYIVREDRSIMEFLDADYTFVNGRLAQLYGIPGIIGDEFQKVQVDRSRRGGIFTQASFLTLTAKPLGSSLRTSPVVRGKWILENIFNETIPPPPPDVPELKIDQNQELKGTVRQIFEQHRADPVCAGCHARMDPYGFALENYDGYGAWREQDNGTNVDPSGTINGKSFATPVEFRAIMADRKDDFRVALVRKMFSYALGRGILASDRETIEEIANAVKTDGDRFSSLILNVVNSYPFQYARSTASPVPLAPVVEAASPAAAAVYHPVPFPPDSAEIAAAEAAAAAAEANQRQRQNQNQNQNQNQGQGQQQAPAQVPAAGPARPPDSNAPATQ